jgi:ABC-type phosphate transport system substrate-binding protein
MGTHLTGGRGPVVALVLALLACLLVLLEVPRRAQASASHSEIEGSGSSWAYNAVLQWTGDVFQQGGLQVVITSTGSAQGRQDFANGSTDYAVSDIGYQGKDPLTGNVDQSTRAYVYLPIVSGGTAFPYQIMVGGHLVRNLRLSGKTLAKIFTNQITNWNDPAVTADNNGRQFPDIPIVPVVHAEGSGSTAQFTTYLDTVFPDIWRPFAGGAASSLPPGKAYTEYYPVKGAVLPENGSDQVMSTVSAGGTNGAIAYDEYSYPLGKNFPVAKIENSAHFFTLPDQYNVAVALTQAQIDPTTLLQTLTNVYTYNDPRTYPLSSYSYGIIPTAPNDPRMTTAKRQTLVDFLYYSICGGQHEIGPIGYSSLPLNLVQASFNQINKLKAADAGVDITARDPTTCNNPTFDPKNPTKNLLAEVAPQPPACDQEGQGPSDADGKCTVAAPTGGGQAPAGDGGGNGPNSGAPAGGTGAGPNAVAPGPAAGAGAKSGGATAGKVRAQPGAGGGTTSNAGQATSAQSDTGAQSAPESSRTSLADGPPSLLGFHATGVEVLLIPLAALLLLVVLVAPALIVLAARRTRKQEA